MWKENNENTNGRFSMTSQLRTSMCPWFFKGKSFHSTLNIFFASLLMLVFYWMQSFTTHIDNLKENCSIVLQYNVLDGDKPSQQN